MIRAKEIRLINLEVKLQESYIFSGWTKELYFPSNQYLYQRFLRHTFLKHLIVFDQG